MLAFAAAQLLFFSLGDFTLQSGQVLQQTKVGYRTFGEMNPNKSNVILIPSWFNGTSANWETYIGPGNIVDPQGYFVVVADALSNGVSTSPSNSPTQHGDKFPRIAISDMVETQYRLLRSLGVKHLHAVVGVSMGGMQVFQWTVQYPDYMTKAVSIVGTPRMGTKDMLLWSTMVKMPALGGGSGNKSLMDLFSPNSQNSEAQKQFDELLNGNEPSIFKAAPGGSPAASLPKSPNDVRMQFEAIVAHNIAKNFGNSLPEAAKAIKAKMLVASATHDQVVSPDLPLEFAGMLKAETLKLESDKGHNSYKYEKDKLGPVVNEFLRRR